MKVFSTANSCVGNIFKALSPKKWGTIFDGADGVGGADGCAPVSLGAYQATGTTDVNGNVTIIVPPLALSWNNQYLVIGRATNFDYVKTAVAGDTLYSNYPVLAAPAGTSRTVPLSFVATFNGKIVPGKASGGIRQLPRDHRTRVHRLDGPCGAVSVHPGRRRGLGR